MSCPVPGATQTGSLKEGVQKEQRHDKMEARQEVLIKDFIYSASMVYIAKTHYWLLLKTTSPVPQDRLK